MSIKPLKTARAFTHHLGSAALAAAICAAGALYADVPQVNGTDFFFKGV